MLNTVLRHARNVNTSHQRVFSSSARLASSRPLRTTRYISLFHEETREPIWRLLDALHSTSQSLDLVKVLQNAKVSQEEFNHWSMVLYEHDIATALAKLKPTSVSTDPHSTPRMDIATALKKLKGRAMLPKEESEPIPIPPHIPAWVILYLAGFKVRTPTHANGPLMHLVSIYFDSLPPALQGPFLILTMLQVARFNLAAHMRPLVDKFLTIPLDDPALQFNLMLQAMACKPTSSTENAEGVVSLLKAMKARQLKLTSKTYDGLLHDRFVAVQLTRYLQSRMIKEGHVPTASQLESYLRIFAKDGAIHDARKYLDAIHTLSAEAIEKGSSDAQERAYRANTVLLANHNDRTSAFEFLRELYAPPEELNTEVSSHLRLPKRPQLAAKSKTDVYITTATFAVMARDHSISSDRLIETFEKMTVRTNIVTYTILIRGLLQRKKFQEALFFWRKFRDTGLLMDKQMLTVGLQVLTRAKKPHQAIMLLEAFAGPRKGGEDVFQLHDPIQLTTVSINEFLVALVRLRRPDLVFKLWDHMGELYGVYPDADTLSILLQAARVAYRLDDTLSGAIATLGLKNPFRKQRKNMSTRDDILQSIADVIGQPDHAQPKRYVSGIWNGLPPINAACKVFQQAIFGNDHDKKLPNVKSPADAVRTSLDADPMLALPSFRPTKFEFVPPPDLLTLSGKSRHPNVVVTDNNCFNYIVLLGLGSRATEIPLTLAWMRALDIQPSGSTLAAALVFWAEVSLQAPLVEAWSGGAQKSEFIKLADWVREWVGEPRAPTGKTLLKWRGIVKNMRQSDG
ncbi:hypothetical protein BDQ12DRAFT_654227 [Crucibulum laeve]|uniref:Pentacotripeptide-repeat region of PRORP domain-containing protein n=1 Tax=Crucibulum laeve TaxID=68775 RepID=A0A5C3LUU1_9AGAR|nr:hypothetical protein BDQ12DRAFT_654227 [Crucibulum laeve]